MGCTTSASTRNVVVSDQPMTATLKCRWSAEKVSCSILVNGHGPAMQETRALWNTFPSPASSESDPRPAFHLLPAPQRGPLLHGVFPRFTTSNVLTALPMFASVVDFTV